MNIVETSWNPASNLALTRFAFPEIEDVERYKQAYTASTDQGEVLIGRLGDFEPIRGSPFRDHLHQQTFEGVWDATFVVDAFGAVRGRGAPAVRLDYDFDPVPLADELLRNSRGVLIWTYQLENLYAAFGHTPSECVAFRRDFNLRRPAAFEKAAGLSVGRGLTMLDLVKDRMRFGFIRRPNLYAGRVVWEHANRSA